MNAKKEKREKPEATRPFCLNFNVCTISPDANSINRKAYFR